MTTRLRTVLPLTLLLAVLAPPVHSQVDEPVYAWDDEAPGTAQLGDWRPDVQPAPYFETWDFWFWTDDGEFITLQYVISSLGFGIERQGSVRGTVVAPGAVSLGEVEPGIFRARRGFEWEDGDWSFEPDGFRVDFLDCTIGGDGESFDLRMHDNTIKLEVDMHMQAPLFEPGDGVVRLGWDRRLRYELDVLPRFSFEGRLSTRRTRSDEETWRDIRGVGYAEHSRVNGLPVMVGTQWIGFRALRADGLTVIYDDFAVDETYGSGRYPWVLVLLDGEPIFTSTDVQVVQTDVRPDSHPPSTYPVPYAYQVVARSGVDTVTIEVGNTQLVQMDNILSRVSRFVRAVLSSMMNPMDYEFTADYDVWLDIGGHQAAVSGRGWTTANFPR